MLIFLALTMIFYVLCVFLNPYYAANLHRTHGIEVPVFKFCIMGFIGTLVITLIYLMNMEPNNHSIDQFTRAYKRHIRKLNDPAE